MAKTTLPTNFKDDVLNASMNGKRRYLEIPNTDGTVSLEDKTAYTQTGSDFGASQVNEMNRNINESADAGKIIDSLDAITANTQSGYMAGALAVKELNNSLSGIVVKRFNYTSSITINPNNAMSIEFDSIIPSGSTRILGVVGYHTGNTVLSASNINIKNNKVNMAIYNAHSSAASGTPYVDVLFV